MLPATGPRGRMLGLAASIGFLLVFIFAFLTWQTPSRMPSFPKTATADL